ncbi:ATP-binding protein [Nocardia sp. PE-7]|uniref:sensor histidine kinase n=1 Tax=Nocardia sp. PE-7 TaxID=3058426 RepID=UPI0026591C6D|nr:ATP-binding protein [Nocardia sp. PE-7]WKG12431.1 ATP-binding protein [Nocardia sp. PE-7]
MATDTASTSHVLRAAIAGATESRLTRLFARFIASGYLFYLLLLVPTIAAQYSVLDPWWTVFAVVAVFGPPMVMGAVSFHLDLRWSRRVAAVTAVSYLAAALTWPLAWRGDLMIADAWISGIPGLAGLAAAVAWGPVRTIGLLAVAVFTVQLINQFCRTPDHNAAFLPDLLFGLSFCLLYVAAALMALHTGRLLDRTRTEAHSAAAAAAAAQARAVQRVRFNALLHDWVMSTLLAAARGTRREDVRLQAQLTLHKLDNTRPDTGTSYPLPAAAAYFRAALTDVDDTLVPKVTIGPGEVVLPGDPVQVLGAAVSEAVRNSVRHAGPRATRTVELAFSADSIEVTCADDGVGFVPSQVPEHRLGLAVSIIERVRGLPGGAVEIHTRPGAGTVIRLGWKEPAA